MFERIWDFFRRRPTTSASAGPQGQTSVRPGSDPEIVEHRIPRADLDADAVKIVQRLTRYRYTAYLVGGCVRDLLLGLKPKDFDIATSATPRQVKRLFRNSRVIGRRFRLAHVYFRDGKIIEVATFRSRDEGAPEDGDVMIRDDNRFGTPTEDALRRDFTINQLFYDVGSSKVIDHAGGLADLQRRLVRTIGEPELRFREDPIRILRAIKFAARLDLDIEASTLAALKKTRDDIPKAAAARVLEEINRFCQGGRARRSFELLFEHGIFEVILPEVHALYAGQDRCRELLLDLLDGLDRRTAEGIVPDTGEILAALVLPGLIDDLGWTTDGKASQPRGLNTRELVDTTVRPLATRLRFPRRDQETCRQIVMMLYRMAPHERVRRNSKRSILGRQCLPSAIWILERLGRRFGGVFSSASTYWGKFRGERPTSTGEQERPAPGGEERPAPGGEERPAPGGEERPAPSGEERPRGRRRGSRGRRGGANRQEARRTGPARKDEESAPGGSAKERPKPKPGEDGWDEDYFFSALPTVPQLEEDDGKPNRYGGAPVGSVAVEDDEDKAEAEAETETEPATEGRRRPRRRRRRRRRPAAETSEETTDE
jgi:poly(A) polymerase